MVAEFTVLFRIEYFKQRRSRVAAMLREGRLTILDQQPIVARALEQIMAQDDDEESGAGGAPTLDLQLG